MVKQFHNLSDEYLADLIGEQDAMVKPALARLEALKAEAKERPGFEDVSGDHYRVSITRGERKTLDLKALKMRFGSEIAAYEGTAQISTLRITPLFQQKDVCKP